MLDHQREHIDAVFRKSKDKITNIYPFDPLTRIVAQEIAVRITTAFPTAEVIHFGSSKLGIAGENDVDLTAIVGNDFDKALQQFEEWYGKPARTALHDNFAQWIFEQSGFPVELQLLDVRKSYFEDQLKTQFILEHDDNLREKYEEMKLASNGVPYYEYLKRKYEFWNNLIGR